MVVCKVFTKFVEVALLSINVLHKSTFKINVNLSYLVLSHSSQETSIQDQDKDEVLMFYDSHV
jgi:hypothetical protein